MALPLPAGYVLVEDDFVPDNTLAPIPTGYVLVDEEPTALDYGKGLLDVGATLGSGVLHAASGATAGLIGLAEAAISDEISIEDLDEAKKRYDVVTSKAYAPQTKEGKELLQALGGLAENVVDGANFVAAPYAALTELIAGQGFDQAVKTLDMVLNEGMGATLEKRIGEESGSEVAGRFASYLPAAAELIFGAKGATKAASSAKKGAEAVSDIASDVASEVGDVVSDVGNVVSDVASNVGDVVSDISKIRPRQSPLQQETATAIEGGLTDTVSAPFKVAEAPTAKTRFGEKLFERTGANIPRLAADPKAVAVIDQGFDPAVVALTKHADKADNTAFRKMVDIRSKGIQSARYAALNRSTDVVGDTVMNRYRIVDRTNREAGKRLDVVARNELKGQRVDFKPAISSFVDDLKDMGVNLGRGEGGSLRPYYKGSDIEGLQDVQKIIDNVVTRLRSPSSLDAYQLHQTKRYLDANLDYAKQTGGLAGRVGMTIKNLRHNIDQILDENFPLYDQVNTRYADTINAKNNFQLAMGRKMDLGGEKASQAVGTALRRALGNAQSRISLQDAFEELEKIAKKYGDIDDPALKGNLIDQLIFSDELDTVLGPSARTSFQSETSKAVKAATRGARDSKGMIMAAVEEIVEGMGTSKNRTEAVKAMRKLLAESNNLKGGK